MFLIKSMGVLCEKWIMENRENLVDAEYASEAPKRRSPNIGERSAKWVKLLMQF